MKWKTKATICYFVVFIVLFLTVSVWNFGTGQSPRPLAMSVIEILLLSPFFYCFLFPTGIFQWTFVLILNAFFWAHVFYIVFHFVAGISAAVIRSRSERNNKPITVDGIDYRWSFSCSYFEDSDFYELMVTVQAASGNSAKILATGSCEEIPFLMLPRTNVSPKLVASIIREAKRNGWSPDSEQDYRIEDLHLFENISNQDSPCSTGQDNKALDRSR